MNKRTNIKPSLGCKIAKDTKPGLGYKVVKQA